MKHIRVLPKHVANQIAAGEVVDRPASIVKELVENAIDAGSTSVTIEISGGGIEYIRVSDNGSGIAPEDVPVSFLRHATSKIAATEDLARIGTLGFRGEALASIAAVARVTMRTCESGAEAGVLFRIEGGEVKEHTETGCAPGTSIEVRNLFYNVPARLKFLKSARSEAAGISDYVSRAIMCRPDIAFRFINNGKTAYQSSGDGKLESAIHCVYGAEALPHLKKTDFYDGRFRITGFIGTEQLARPTRQQQSLYVNRRYVKSQQIAYGIARAYDTRLMGGKFPFFVLNLEVDLEDVDVNVHPNKLEVRFKDEQGVVRAATIAARMALGDPVAPVIVKEDIKPERVFVQPDEKPVEAEIQSIKESARELFKPAANRSAVKVKEGVSGIMDSKRPFVQVVPPAPVERQEHVKPPAAAPVRTASVQGSFGSEAFSIVGQLFGCYWVVQQGERVFFIDQHAAHERRLYERLMDEGLAAESQILLVPAVEKLTPQEYDILMDNLDRFSELGFEIEEFGPYTVQVRAVPSIMQAPESAGFLHEAIGLMESRGRLLPQEAKRGALIQFACKHAIKAGEQPSRIEIEALLREYAAEGVPMTCPHGRPVMVQMTRLEFEKLFKRVL